MLLDTATKKGQLLRILLPEKIPFEEQADFHAANIQQDLHLKSRKSSKGM